MTRKIRLADVPTNKPDTFVRVEVAYSAGGMSFATYKQIARGYKLRVRVMETDGVWERFVLFNGTDVHLADAARFGQKAMEKVAAEVKQADVKALILAVLADEQNAGITLAPEAVIPGI